MSISPAQPILLGDIGGTNARFAILENGRIGGIASMLVKQYPDIGQAIDAFLSRIGRPAAEQAILAVAGPVENNCGRLTNSTWHIDGAELCKQRGFKSVHVLNDFEATAWSLPAIPQTDLFVIGKGRPVRGAPMIVLGPGTGFGIACYIPSPPRVITTEGGHATIPGTNKREDVIIDWLRQRYGHVSIERAISGGGLENLYQALATLDQISVPERSAMEITKTGLEGSCSVCRAALDLFCAMLGTVAGNAALSFGARGGVYIAGGIAPRIVEHLARSTFRERFEAMGRFRDYMERIPTSVIVHVDATFVGMKAWAERA
ncbi:MAG TPA: glucokinase [Xanthobacteraceae bacterium]|nr:glucokinase [Xanthobacteraceae bacterium]